MTGRGDEQEWAVPGVHRPSRDGGGARWASGEHLDRTHPVVRVVVGAREELSALLTGSDRTAEGETSDTASGSGSRGLHAPLPGARQAIVDLADASLVGLYRELASLTAASAAVTAAVVAEVAARDLPSQVGERSVNGWLQRAGRLTRSEASREQSASSAVLAVPAVTAALAAGAFSPRAATLLSSTLSTVAAMPSVSAGVYAEAEETALRLACQLDAMQLSRALQALQEALTTEPDVDDEAEAERLADAAAKAWRERYLVVNTETGRVTGRLPVAMAEALQTALDALAAHRSRDLPPEALAAAQRAGARVWIDHVEGCPAEEPDAEGSDDNGGEGAAAPFAKSCRCPWRVEWPLICTCGLDESKQEGHEQAAAEGHEQAAAEGHEQVAAEAPAPSSGGQTEPVFGGRFHADDCAASGWGERGHDESGEPLLRRSRAQSQADALFELAHMGLDAQLLPTQDAAPPHLTLHATPADLDRPVPVATYPDGVVAPPTAVATVLCDAVTTTVLFDGEGKLLAVSGSQRTWPRHLRRAIAARDRRCAFPGCEAVPALCHVHHMVHVEHGGPTCADNGCLLCPLHHALVHDLGWEARLNPRNGRPEFQPPTYVDPQQRWRQHPRYQLEHLRRTGCEPRPDERDRRRCRAAGVDPPVDPDAPVPF
ncbi:MAG: DUF222 domain-containing protein [Actinomycetes bacterium]